MTGEIELQRDLPMAANEAQGLACGLATNLAGDKMVVVTGGMYDIGQTAQNETYIFDYEVYT